MLHWQYHIPGLLHSFSSFLEFKVKSAHLTHYFDNLLFGDPAWSAEYASYLATFQILASELRVPLTQEKSKGLCTLFSFLSIPLDSSLAISHFPDKLLALRTILYRIINSKNMHPQRDAGPLGLPQFCLKDGSS